MEQPNLDYINDIARGEDAIKKELIGVVKKEFPEEKKEYFKSLENQDFNEIVDLVHRIKHKFIILGLTKSYEMANKYEENLRENILQEKQKEDFNRTLEAIELYLTTI